MGQFQLRDFHLKVRSASIAAYRISLTMSPHFVWISCKNFLFFIFQCFTWKFEFYNLTKIERKKLLRMKKFASGKPALRSSMSTNIHRIPHLTLKLWNDAEETFKCKWPNALIFRLTFSHNSKICLLKVS